MTPSIGKVVGRGEAAFRDGGHLVSLHLSIGRMIRGDGSGVLSQIGSQAATMYISVARGAIAAS